MIFVADDPLVQMASHCQDDKFDDDNTCYVTCSMNPKASTLSCSAGSSSSLSSVRGLMAASFSSPQPPNLGADPSKPSPVVIVPGQATAVSNSGKTTYLSAMLWIRGQKHMHA